MTCSGGLGLQTWTELDDRRATVVVPLGSLEQHGPHLPLDTDTRIASAVAVRGVEEVRRRSADLGGVDAPDLLIAPELNYGASGEHEDFPGTVSIGHEALRMVLVEYARSACRWAARVAFVNGHGGNVGTLAEAVACLRLEGRDVAWFACTSADADAHAGVTETSLLLHISPDSVRQEQCRIGNTASIGSLMSDLRSSGVRAVSPSGVLGDPRAAAADRGRRDLDAMATRLSDALARWTPDHTGMLR